MSTYKSEEIIKSEIKKAKELCVSAIAIGLRRTAQGGSYASAELFDFYLRSLNLDCKVSNHKKEIDKIISSVTKQTINNLAQIIKDKSKSKRKSVKKLIKEFVESIKNNYTLLVMNYCLDGDDTIGGLEDALKLAMSGSLVDLPDKAASIFVDQVETFKSMFYDYMILSYKGDFSQKDFDDVIDGGMKTMSILITSTVGFAISRYPQRASRNMDLNLEMNLLKGYSSDKYESQIFEDLISIVSEGIAYEAEWDNILSNCIETAFDFASRNAYVELVKENPDSGAYRDDFLAVLSNPLDTEGAAIKFINFNSVFIEESKNEALETCRSIVQESYKQIHLEAVRNRARDAVSNGHTDTEDMECRYREALEQDERDYTNRRWRSIESRVMNLEDRGRRQDSEYNHGSERGRRAFASRDMGRGGSRVRGGRTMDRGRG